MNVTLTATIPIPANAIAPTPVPISDADGNAQPYIDFLSNFDGTGLSFLVWAAGNSTNPVKIPAAATKIDATFLDLLNTVSGRREGSSGAINLDGSACTWDQDSGNAIYTTLWNGSYNYGVLNMGSFVPTGSAVDDRTNLINNKNFTVTDGIPPV